MRQRRNIFFACVLTLALLVQGGPVWAGDDALLLLNTPTHRDAPPVRLIRKVSPKPHVVPAPEQSPAQTPPVVLPEPTVEQMPAVEAPPPVLLANPVPVVPVLQQPVPVATPSPAPLGAKLTPAAPQPSVPHKSPVCPRFACDGVYWLAACFAALAMGWGVWRWRRSTFRDAQTLSTMTGLAVISQNDATRMRACLSSGHNVVVVTATQAGEGASKTALSLARASAQARQRTILIDCNLHTPSLQHHVPDRAAPTLIDMLAGQARLAEIVQRDPQTGLHLVPTRAIPNTAHDLLQSSAFTKVLEALHDVYDLVVLDAPALSVAVEARGLCARADHVLYCVARGRAPRATVMAGLQAMPQVVKAHMSLVLTGK